jgi:putative ABC transport system permease protein
MTGLRQIVAQKLYSVINIVGLAVGLASVVLIGLYVRHELSYESMFPNADRIFRISRDYYAREGSPDRVPAQINAPVGPALLAEVPEVERVARVFGGNVLFRRGDRAFYEMNFRWADPALLEIFELDWIAGDPATALAAPGSLVLTESLATKYFGGESPLGQTITLNGSNDVTVTGVIRDLPASTHLVFDALAPMEALAAVAGPRLMEDWNANTDFHTYFELRSGASIEAVRQRIPEFMTRHFTPDVIATSGITTMNVRDIHLRSTRDEEWKPASDIATVYASATIAAMILLIACINFMNLSTARSAKRAREVGVRKSLGASRFQLIVQFLGESVATALIAMLVATMIVELALPAFSAFVGADLSFEYLSSNGLGAASTAGGPGGGIALWLVLLAVAVGVAAGSYPAFYLSAFSSAKVLKGDVSRGVAGARFRNVLVMAQFAIAIALLVGTAVVYEQTRFARNLDLGFDKDEIVVLAGSQLSGMRRQWSPLRAELERVPGVVGVTASHYTPFSFDDNRFVVRRPGAETVSRIQFMAVDYDFFETYRIEVLEGRGFAPSFGSDLLLPPSADGPPPPAGFVVNESGARLLGWTPSEARDQAIEIALGPSAVAPGSIVGVVRDTYFESVAEPVRPMIYMLGAEPRGMLFNFIDTVSARVTGQDVAGTLAGIDAAWRKVLPNEPIVRRFLDEDFDAQYRSEQRQMQMFTSFAALAIFIACLGLLGLAWFSTERRTKEIGIRKTLGGSVWDVVRLFTTEFSRLVLLANLVAWPIAYFVMQRWLQGFAYRIDLGVTLFIGSALVALAVALLTVGGVAARAASAKPLNALRYE